MRRLRGVGAPLVKLAIFAVVTVVLSAVLAQTLGGFGFGGGTEYRARFTDVTGVLVGDDVRIAGVKVGRVTGIKLVPGAAGGAPVAELSFTVDDAVPLSSTVLAKIRYRNLVGQRYLALAEGPGAGARLTPGGLIPLAQTTAALDLTVVFRGFQPLFTALTPDDVNRLSYEIIQVLQGEGGTVTSLLSHTASLTGTLADRDEVIGRVITNLNAVLATLAGRDHELGETVHQLQLFVSGLSADRTAIGAAIVSIGDLADATSSLVRQARPDLKADITSLGTLAGTLNQNSSVIDSTLRRLPGRLEALSSTASDGSWFTFFLCDFDGHVGAGSATVAVPTFSSSAARCQVPGTPVGGAK